jgi:hypothetical protein
MRVKAHSRVETTIVLPVSLEAIAGRVELILLAQKRGLV